MRENDSPAEMGRRQEWAEGTSDYSPGLTEFQPRRYGTRSDGGSERSPTLVRGPCCDRHGRAAGEGPVLGQGLKGVAAGGARRLVFERQGLSLERSEWCLSRGSFEICVLWEVAS